MGLAPRSSGVGAAFAVREERVASDAANLDYAKDTPNEYDALNHGIVLGDVVGLGGVELYEFVLLQFLGRLGINVFGVT